MHAILQPEGIGGPETLVWTQAPEPVAGPGEVVIDIAAAGVNRADLLQRQGRYDPPPGSTPIMGLECAGRVHALGPGVTSLAVGDRVAALLVGGGYAQRVAVPAAQVMPVPASLSLIEAAALPEVACTVWSNVFMSARLAQGEWLLVHGGGSGIGTHAIQVARAAGARIAVTAGSDDKLQACADLGADLLINHRTQDFAEVIAEEIGGVDVVLDIIGAKYLARNVAVLNRNGRIAVIGMQGGVRGELDLGALLGRNGTIHAASLRGRPPAEKADICRQVERFVWPWIDAGLVRPVIAAQLPMSSAGEAHRLLEDGQVTGKILLTVDGAGLA